MAIQGIDVQWQAEALVGEGAIAPGLIEEAAWLGDPDWFAELLAAGADAAGAASFGLVATDNEGVAHHLGGTIPTAEIGPQLLEALESTLLWNSVESRRHYPAGELRAILPSWPDEPRLGARFYRDQDRLLGALLSSEESHPLQRGPSEDRQGGFLGAPTEGGADDLVEMILHHWRLRREATALWEYTHALTRVQQRALIAVDQQGRVTYLSPGGAKLLGVDRREALGADCSRILRPAMDGPHPLLQGLEGDLGEIEFYATDRSGRDVPISLRMQRIRGRHGEMRGLIGLFQDLTEERALGQEARRRERLAVIGELVAGAAHEIRNPLTAIGNCAQVLQMRFEGDEKNLKLATLILSEMQRLERIVTSMLRFARPGPPSLRETRMEELVRDQIQMEEAVCQERGIRCEVRIAGTIPPIYVDPEQLRQVLQNLIRNAVQAMPEGGLLTAEVEVVRRRLHMRRRLGRRATDRVHVPTEGPQARFVRIGIGDTGAGISQDVLPRIFDPFFTTRSEGTGLGLAVSQSIVQEHGGLIAARSVQGKGTVFEVDLPVERRQGERRKEHSHREESAEEPSADRR